MNNIAKQANFRSNGARYMEFGLLDSGDKGGYNGVGFDEVSQILATQASLFSSEQNHLRDYTHR